VDVIRFIPEERTSGNRWIGGWIEPKSS